MKEINNEIKAQRHEEYNQKARKYPAYLSLVIPVVLGVAMGVKDSADSNLWIKAVVYLLSVSTISAALFFLLRFTLRDISKIFPEKILFCDRLKPTTRLLYSGDKTFSEEKKANIRKKIKSKKNIDLQKFRVKTYTNKEYVKRVDEAVSWLLDVTRFDDILFEYNWIFGFWRNISAGFLVDSVLVFILSAVNKWIFVLPFGSSLIWIGIIVFFVAILSAYVAYYNGLIFAKKVYDVFMNLNDDENNY